MDKKFRLLVCCEESQRVCTAFRERGWEAYSCDIEPCSGGHPEWHIQQDVLPLINGDCTFTTMDGVEHHIDGQWDLLICHPPCTYLSNAGARHLWKGHQLNQERYAKGLEAKAFFMEFYNARCEHVVVENPIPSKIYELPAYTQTVQPYEYYGEWHPYTKKTCLWERNVPQLIPVNPVEPVATWCPSGSYSHKHGAKHKGMFTTDRAKNRSKTFEGIAQAMADQWGAYIEGESNG